MASGTIDGDPQADDVNFAPQPEPSCSPAAALPAAPTRTACSAPVAANRPVVGPLAETRSYPARKGFDEFYGYGRVEHGERVERRSDAATIPPEAEITSPRLVRAGRPGARDRRRRGRGLRARHAYTAGSTSRRARAQQRLTTDCRRATSSRCRRLVRRLAAHGRVQRRARLIDWQP